MTELYEGDECEDCGCDAEDHDEIGCLFHEDCDNIKADDFDDEWEYLAADDYD